MEFDFVSLAFGGEQHISIWDSKRIAMLKTDDQELLTKLLDVFGKKSAVAQGLGAPVTDIYRLRSTDQRLYLYMYRESRKTVVLGGLKVGSKRLFVRTGTADLREIEPVCVLDFYVHESCQRQGVGKALFEQFLTAEGHDPATLAYDRPSPKLLAFLKKHYGLDQYVPQSNNYVVFDRYWELCPPGSRQQHKGHGAMPPGASGQLQGRNASRGSIASIGTPSGHGGGQGGQGPRPTPLMGMMPPGSGAGGYPPHWTPSALGSPSSGPPAPIGNSPSFGRRWASNNFGQGPSQAPPPYPAPGTAGGPAFSIPPAGDDAQGGIVDALDAFARLQQQPQGAGTSSPQRGGAGAPWEAGATGLAGAGYGGGAPGTWPPQGGPALPPAGAPSGMQPPGSRGAYSYRPPWATEEPAGPSGAGGVSSGSGGVDAGPGPGPGYAGFGSPPPPMRTPSTDRFGRGAGGGGPVPVQRSPMQSILGGGGGYDAVAGGRSGAAQTRALQQQLLSMQSGDGAAAAAAAGGPALGGYGGGVYPGSYQQQQQAPPSLYSGAPPAPGSGLGGAGPGGMAPGGADGAGGPGMPGGTPPPAGGQSAAKMMAVKQRSGAGAADCLVW